MPISLWDHQEKFGDFILKDGLQALWWAMRTGKTLTAAHGSRNGDRLIICPNGVKQVWARDLAKYDGIDDSWVVGTGKKPSRRPRNVILNYESVTRKAELLAGEWDTVIFDESHRISNPRTKLWECLGAYLGDLHRGRVVLLSGTPCPEGSHQMITQTILATGEFNGYRCPWEALREGWVFNEYRRKWEANPGTDALVKEIMHSYGHSMTQKEAGIHTKKLHRSVYIPVSKEEIKLWKTHFDPNAEPTQKAQLAQSCASGRDKVLQATAHSEKLLAVCDYVADLGAPCVVLCHFLASLDYLSRNLDRLKIAHGTISGEDGGTVQRAKVINDFDTGKFDVLVCTVPTVKVGVNLSRASCLIFAENNWSGEARIQAEERCTVRGKEAVEVIDFLAACPEIELVDKVDAKIASAVRGKQDFNVRMLST